jgi:potassium-transporting ATPase KdpC subunit
MKKLAITALGMLAIMTVITGVIYPLAVTLIAETAFPHQARGSMIVGSDGKTRGSELIGQPFEDPKYFWGRLSATSPTPYNGGASTGSNLGPTNEALTKAAKARMDALRAVDPGNEAKIPVDLVTSSASGLDPDITPAAAAYQAPRVARMRMGRIPEDRVRALITAHTKDRTFGILGEKRVNVLLLNMALDREDEQR